MFEKSQFFLQIILKNLIFEKRWIKSISVLAQPAPGDQKREKEREQSLCQTNLSKTNLSNQISLSNKSFKSNLSHINLSNQISPEQIFQIKYLPNKSFKSNLSQINLSNQIFLKTNLSNQISLKQISPKKTFYIKSLCQTNLSNQISLKQISPK